MDLASVVQGAIETSAPLIEGASHRLTVSLPDQPLVVDADPIRQFERIAGFGGFSADPGWRERVEALSFPNRNDRWRSKLDAEALATIQRVQDVALKEHGYEL